MSSKKLWDMFSLKKGDRGGFDNCSDSKKFERVLPDGNNYPTGRRLDLKRSKLRMLLGSGQSSVVVRMLTDAADIFDMF